MSSPALPDKSGVFRSLPSFLLGTFTRNLPAKIAALVLAILVWYTVRLDLTAKETFHPGTRCSVFIADWKLRAESAEVASWPALLESSTHCPKP